MSHGRMLCSRQAQADCAYRSVRSRQVVRTRCGWRAWLAAAAALLAVAACGGTSSSSSSSASGGGGLQIVSAENFWGSIVGQVGGAHVHVTNVINSPRADPHDYEPTPNDARMIARARHV